MYNKPKENLYRCLFDMGKLKQTKKIDSSENSEFDFNSGRAEFLNSEYKHTELIQM